MTRAVASGDQDARRLLAERLMDKIHRTLSYLSFSREEAEDFTQTALIQILRSAGSFRGECSLEYWATRVAIQTMAKKLEKRTRRAKLREVSFEPLLDTRDTDEEAELSRARVRLTEKIQTLTAEQQTAVVLHYLHGYGIDEIADITNSPVNTTRGRLREIALKYEGWSRRKSDRG